MTHPISSTMFHVLDILNDCKLHTGSEIAKLLGISRTAVWKVVQRLKKYDVAIDTLHQGYSLKNPIFLLSKEKIQDSLKDNTIPIAVFESLTSTRDYFTTKKTFPNKAICVSEYQSMGKGRLGRLWESPFGCNVYCSLGYDFEKEVSDMSGLSLVVGLSIARTLADLYPTVNPLLKWPNDIYVNSQKVGGILIEMTAEANGHCKAIISFGLNVNMKEVALPINQPWTSLEHVLNKKLDRNIIFGRIVKEILKDLDVFSQQGLDPFLSYWDPFDYLKDQMIQVTMGKSEIRGFARGINNSGALVLDLQNGTQQICSFGDTTLIKS